MTAQVSRLPVGHKLRTIVVDGLHIWECSRCLGRWLPADQPRSDDRCIA